MTAPLISDATLAKIVRILWSPEYCARLDPSDRDMIAGLLVEQKYSDALDYAAGLDVVDDPIPLLWGAIDEANDEAARTHNERELRGEWITPEAVPGLARAMGEVIAALPDVRSVDGCGCPRCPCPGCPVCS